MLKVLTRKEIAQQLRLSLRTLDYLTATKQIPFKRMGRSIRFSERAIEKWLEEGNGADLENDKSL